MLTMFVLAALVTVVLLGFVFFGGLIVGTILLYSRKLRLLAPFVLFIPPLGVLGATGGSWGTAIWAVWAFPPPSKAAQFLPFWAWVIGFPVGGVCGALLGLWLAILLRRRLCSGGIAKPPPPLSQPPSPPPPTIEPLEPRRFL